ncbi:MAG: hypothetical protein QOC62_4915 [Mycobacterium sp.]|nr:hypothetical protein [Mycobacterium sp.]
MPSIVDCFKQVSASSRARAGITNTATLGESSDPGALLHTLDALAPKAPAAISADFAAFERLEHLLLGPAPADPTAAQTAYPSGTRALLSPQRPYPHGPATKIRP